MDRHSSIIIVLNKLMVNPSLCIPPKPKLRMRRSRQTALGAPWPGADRFSRRWSTFTQIRYVQNHSLECSTGIREDFWISPKLSDWERLPLHHVLRLENRPRAVQDWFSRQESTFTQIRYVQNHSLECSTGIREDFWISPKLSDWERLPSYHILRLENRPRAAQDWFSRRWSTFTQIRVVQNQ